MVLIRFLSMQTFLRKRCSQSPIRPSSNWPTTVSTASPTCWSSRKTENFCSHHIGKCRKEYTRSLSHSHNYMICCFLQETEIKTWLGSFFLFLREPNVKAHHHHGRCDIIWQNGIGETEAGRKRKKGETNGILSGFYTMNSFTSSSVSGVSQSNSNNDDNNHPPLFTPSFGIFSPLRCPFFKSVEMARRLIK